MPTVIIAAHNEATGIERCLRSVFSDKVPGLVVTVVPNACRDETADRARGIAVPPEAKLLVFETEVAGKTNAFNLAERKLKDLGLDYFPRLFLDGDIELAAGSIRALLAATDAPGPRIASATPVFDTTGCSIVSRLLYVAARFNPYHTEALPTGAGLTASMLKVELAGVNFPTSSLMTRMSSDSSRRHNERPSQQRPLESAFPVTCELSVELQRVTALAWPNSMPLAFRRSRFVLHHQRSE